MSDLEELLEAYRCAGGDSSILGSTDTAHLVASGHRILSARHVPGLKVDARETPSGISAKIRIGENVRIQNPVHLCFGVIHKKGSQKIEMDVRFDRGSSASFIAHCVFPRAEKVQHVMNARISIGDHAEMRYSETHYHGLYGGIEVIPKADIRLGKGARYFADFNLTSGRVGFLDIDYSVNADEDAVSELTARVFGHGSDRIRIKDKASLDGKNARSLIKTRVAIEDEATAEVTGITDGNAEGARGHVDCMEIIKDNAVAHAIPIVNVSHPLAKVTHEAAIGSVDKKQMETLMAHGLSPEEAVDVIVKGVLK